MPSLNKAMKILEFDRVRELLADAAPTEGAQLLARSLTPHTSKSYIEKLQKQTTEAKALEGIKGIPVFGSVRDIASAVERADKGASLAPRELMDVAEVFRVARTLDDYLDRDRRTDNPLGELFDGLVPNRHLESEIGRCIVSEEMIADEASGELSDIRRKMRNTNVKIKETLQKYITSPGYSKYLQENIITMRGGRHVIPVRAEYKNEIRGLVHDTSSSGATLFIEPMSVVEANNDLKVLQTKEQKEIEKILAGLSAEVALAGSAAIYNYENITEIAFLFAKAELSFRMNASAARLNDTGEIRLIRARHPLLDDKTVVPITVSLGGEFDTLVITGPNTGGKTVTLKTLGLFCLMAQAGLHIPASDTSSVCIFDQIFADIGDEQSIEQSLSTFSGHMTNTVEILSAIDAHSLVLFDELGAGTDPVEGAALAISILEYVRATGARCAATTHYAELKAFALDTPGVCNASCEFDVETLKPTYRLIIGTPGKSNAFAISKKLGLSDAIVVRAKSLINSENKQFEDVLTRLESDRQAMEKQRAEAESLRREYETYKRDADARVAQVLKEAEKTMEDARLRAKQILDSAKASGDYILEQMDALQKKKDAKDFREQIEATRQAVRIHLRENAADIDPVSERVAKDYVLPRPLKVGDPVILVNINKAGVVLTEPDKNGDVMVQAGTLKTKTNAKNLMLVDGKTVTVTEKKKQRLGNVQLAVKQNFKMELDLRGETGDDGWELVDKYLDDAQIATVKSVTLIHGKGTGALRKAIWNNLKRDRRVKSYRSGGIGEGDTGVTVVELK